MNAFKLKNQKKPYDVVTFDDNKVRITRAEAVDSILFENVAFISLKTNQKIVGPYFIYVFLILMFGGGWLINLKLLPVALENQAVNEFILSDPNIINVPVIIICVCAFVFGPSYILYLFFRFSVDELIIETNGGNKISFNVEAGQGQIIMERIEQEKRKVSGTAP